jgi:hypothetical protein
VRSINLLKVAFDAELLGLRAMMARQGRRAAFAVIALIFALVVLALRRRDGWPCGTTSSPSRQRSFYSGSTWSLPRYSVCWRHGGRQAIRRRKPCG